MKFFSKVLAGFVLAGFVFAGCQTTAIIDNRYEPSLDDYKEVAQKITGELLTHPAITKFEAKEEGRLPRLDIGVIRNATRDPVVIAQFAERAMEELLNSGQVTLVAHDLAAIQANQLDQFLSDGKISLSDQADLYLEGVVSKLSSRGGGRMDVTYTFMLRLNDRERNQLWKKNIDITKQGGDPNRRGGVSLF